MISKDNSPRKDTLERYSSLLFWVLLSSILFLLYFFSSSAWVPLLENLPMDDNDWIASPCSPALEAFRAYQQNKSIFPPLLASNICLTREVTSKDIFFSLNNHVFNWQTGTCTSDLLKKEEQWYPCTIVISHPFTVAWYHSLMQLLPIVNALAFSSFCHDPTFVTSRYPKKHEHILNALKLPVPHMKKGSHTICGETLIFPGFKQNYRHVENLRERIKAIYPPEKRHLVFIERLTSRKIENFSFLFDIARKKVPQLEMISFNGNEEMNQTIAIFQKALGVIGPHGAGFSNAFIFSDSDVPLLEITRKDPETGKIWRSFDYVAAGLKFPYSRILVREDPEAFKTKGDLKRKNFFLSESSINFTMSWITKLAEGQKNIHLFHDEKLSN